MRWKWFDFLLLLALLLVACNGEQKPVNESESTESGNSEPVSHDDMDMAEHEGMDMGSEDSMAMEAMSTPRPDDDLKNGLFVNLTSDEIDRAAMAINFATNVRHETGKPATIFLNNEGVRLVDKNIPQNKHVSGKTIHEMLDSFIDAGGVVLVCPMCMKNVGGLDSSELLDSIIIGTPDYTWTAMFAENVTIINY